MFCLKYPPQEKDEKTKWDHESVLKDKFNWKYYLPMDTHRHTRKSNQYISSKMQFLPKEERWKIVTLTDKDGDEEKLK